ncbi:MAG: S41 family peptidase [Phycisphaerales bacterium]
MRCLRRVRLIGICISSVMSAMCIVWQCPADVGYYQQPAVHGNRLVFVSEGDLFTATLPDDVSSPIIAHRLTSDDGMESRPAISPDGRMIAFSAQYDGNTDVYIMPVDGGMPTRLTFHPGDDVCLGWAPDSNAVLFRSRRMHHFGRWELWQVRTTGGMPERFDFGECSLAAVNSGGKVIAFTRWSNELWTWKGYRGGTAPDIWLGEFASGRFWPLTETDANELFPMWVGARVYFTSDRDGLANLYSDAAQGGDLKVHTNFAFDPQNPADPAGYDVRWPSAESSRTGTRIVFAQGADLVLLETRDDSIHRLDVQIASDRIARRQRFIQPQDSISGFSLSPDGSSVLLETRGEVLSLPADKNQRRVQLTASSAAREFGATYLGDDRLVYISDGSESGEQEIMTMPIDGSESPRQLTTDREDWLFPPAASPDGSFIAFSDKTLRLHVMNVATGERTIIDRADRNEITEYTFSPDSQWLAYTKGMPNGLRSVFLYSIRTGRSIPISTGMVGEHSPAWDPGGVFLYVLAETAINPQLSVPQFDFEFVLANTTQVYAIPLAKSSPPPDQTLMQRSGFDFESWVAAVDDRDELMQIDVAGIESRRFALPIEPGALSELRAVLGGVVWLSSPVQGVLDEIWPPPGPGVGIGKLLQYSVLTGVSTVRAENISTFRISADAATLAWIGEEGIVIQATYDKEHPEKVVSIGDVPVAISIQDEWKQIFHEAWRLQRDFFWAPNFAGIKWAASRAKYEPLLSRVGTREELNDLIGEMIGELRTSHTYLWGGDEYDARDPVNVGLLGVELAIVDGSITITKVLPAIPWETNSSPMAMAHLDVQAGDRVAAIDHVALRRDSNPYQLLQGKVGAVVAITLVRPGAAERIIEVVAIDAEAEAELRYQAWVESNRAYVSEQTEGRIGYIHLPDMDAAGLVAFNRTFAPQTDRQAIIIDIRNNGGGYVSQLIIQRLARQVWAMGSPRHGLPYTYPDRVFVGHLAVVMDQHAGSDGDIFPQSFRLHQLGPLIGRRTWGGVIGIRMDKPFIDTGVSSQPEFAWWEPEGGWTLENKGVVPDIDVDLTPLDRRAGRDTQLDKAIEVLEAKIREQPRALPERPPFPGGE